MQETFSLLQQQKFALYYSPIYCEWWSKIHIYHKQNTITTQSCDVTVSLPKPSPEKVSAVSWNCF